MLAMKEITDKPRREPQGRKGLVLGIQPVEGFRGKPAAAYFNQICTADSSFGGGRFRQEITCGSGNIQTSDAPTKILHSVIRTRLRLLPSARLGALLVALGLTLAQGAQGQALPETVVQQRAQQTSELFNWYYAAVYGTGAYKIGEETVGVIRLPMAYTIRETTDKEWGLRLTFPVSTALADFDLTDFDLGHINAVGVSVLPGIEAEIPLRPGWTVKPFVNAGGGWEFKNDTSAFIWSVGASTLYRRTLDRKWLLGLGAKLIYAGYGAGGTSSILGAVSIGGDLGSPIEMEIAGRQAILGAQIVGTLYFNDLEFLLPGSATQDISNEVEVALTLGVRKPVEFLGAPFDRIGLGYRQGSDGLKGVRLVASFPF